MTVPCQMSDLALESERHERRLLDQELVQQMADNKLRLKALDKEAQRREANRALHGEPRISDHAVLRYLERVKGVDVEAARAEMLTDGLKLASRGGARRYSNGKARFVLNNNTVVTAYER